jgi:hypothetical protein
MKQYECGCIQPFISCGSRSWETSSRNLKG